MRRNNRMLMSINHFHKQLTISSVSPFVPNVPFLYPFSLGTNELKYIEIKDLFKGKQNYHNR